MNDQPRFTEDLEAQSGHHAALDEITETLHPSVGDVDLDAIRRRADEAAKDVHVTLGAFASAVLASSKDVPTLLGLLEQRDARIAELEVVLEFCSDVEMDARDAAAEAQAKRGRDEDVIRRAFSDGVIWLQKRARAALSPDTHAAVDELADIKAACATPLTGTNHVTIAGPDTREVPRVNE